MLGLFLSLSGVGQWHIAWNFLPNYLRCITYSMSLSSENASVFQPRLLKWRMCNWNPILSIQSILSKLWTTRLGSLEIKPVISIRCNGTITPSEKPLGKQRNLFSPTVPSCCKLTKVHHLPFSFQFRTFLKSRDEISFRGKGCNTQVLINFN